MYFKIIQVLSGIYIGLLDIFVCSIACFRGGISLPARIIKRARAYNGKRSRCNLCLAEKLCILTAQNASLVNKKSELVTKCRHENKFFVATNQKKRRSNRS